MTLDALFRSFDLVADAPGAVARMRSVIVDLAVRGKLVSNVVADEPVSLGLRQPPDERSWPANWRLGTLGDAVTFEYGENLPAPRRDSRGTVPVYGSNGVVGSHSAYLTERPAIVIGRKGSAGALNVATGPSWTTDVAFFVQPPSDLDLYFVYYLLASLRLDQLGKGIKPGLSRRDAYGLPIAVPPLAEQKRIVAKVDELMALCDRLEAQQQERDNRRVALAHASLARFADAPTPANLHFLFHKSYSVSPADLRKAILTLAVQGKLIPQRQEDEPAEELLMRLQESRESSGTQAHRRGRNRVTVPAEGEYPHDIPISWSWRRIGQLAALIDYGTSAKADTDSTQIPVYRMGNISAGRLTDGNMKFVARSIADLPALYLKPGDILFNRTNSYELVGKTAIFTGPPDVATFASYLIRIRLPADFMIPEYFNIAMNAPYFRESQIEPHVVQQCGQANFNGTKLASVLVPVPPRDEQQRILDKVNQLMKLVDDLEQVLAESHVTETALLDAVVAELVGESARNSDAVSQDLALADA